MSKSVINSVIDIFSRSALQFSRIFPDFSISMIIFKAFSSLENFYIIFEDFPYFSRICMNPVTCTKQHENINYQQWSTKQYANLTAVVNESIIKPATHGHQSLSSFWRYFVGRQSRAVCHGCRHFWPTCRLPKWSDVVGWQWRIMCRGLMCRGLKSSYWQNAIKLTALDSVGWWLDSSRKPSSHVTSGNEFRCPIVSVHNVHLISVHTGQATISHCFHILLKCPSKNRLINVYHVTEKDRPTKNDGLWRLILAATCHRVCLPSVIL